VNFGHLVFFYKNIPSYFFIAPFYFSKNGKKKNQQILAKKTINGRMYVRLFYVLGGIQNIKGVSKNSHFEYKRIFFTKKPLVLNILSKYIKKNILKEYLDI
jgi:hypothetical protein